MNVSFSNGFAPGNIIRDGAGRLVGDCKIRVTGVFPLFNATDAAFYCKNGLVLS